MESVLEFDPMIRPGSGSLSAEVLVVDDDAQVRSALERCLARAGYTASSVGSGEAALAVLRCRKISCVVLDIGLPDSSGMELVPQLLKVEPHAAIIMLTGLDDAAAATRCLQGGAMEYLTKPFELDSLLRTVRTALARRARQIEQQERDAWLREELVAQGAALRREQGKLERLSLATLDALVNALEAKHAFFRGHAARVSHLAATIAAELGLDDEEIEAVRVAGRLHDIGMIGVQDDLLAKPGRLTPDEHRQIEQHVPIGAQILAPLAHLAAVTAMVRAHHERWDGQGYPDGLAGQAIPLGGRILATVEVFDALATPRSYQETIGPERALEHMEGLVGTVLERRTFEALRAVIGRGQALVFVHENPADVPPGVASHLPAELVGGTW
jgi:putative two-component system response regulator